MRAASTAARRPLSRKRRRCPASPRESIDRASRPVAAMAVAGFMALQIGAISSFGRSLHVTVSMVDAAGVSPGAVVSIADALR